MDSEAFGNTDLWTAAQVKTME